jgi:hypothetical protein
MSTWLQVLVVLVGALLAVTSFFFFSRKRAGVVWAAGWGVVTIAAVVLHGWGPQVVFWAAVAVWQVWWVSLRPRLDRDWAPDVARQATGLIAGDRLVMHDVRNFDWRAEDDATERWETRSYDLAALESVDLFASYWTIESIAHLIVSFGFAGQGQLAFSIEIRRQRGEPWSAFGGLFKMFELVTVAADERDVVRVRTAVRGEDVRLYRLRTTPEFRRRLLAAYVADCNRLASEPRYFHTFLTNCTTQVVRLVRAAGQSLPLDWRMIASGYLPRYLHAVGLLAPGAFAGLRARASVGERARAAGDVEDFSVRIREGVPRPG